MATKDTKPACGKISSCAKTSQRQTRTDDVETEADEAVVLSEREGGRKEACLEREDVLEVVD